MTRKGSKLGADLAGAVLTIDLDAIVGNYRLLRDRLEGAECAAVVKADAYGLGAREVAPALARAGCRHFFVAQLEEALALRPVLGNASLYVLNGLLDGAAPWFIDNEIVPILNDLEQITRWSEAAREHGLALPAIVHVDTGMNRLGLPPTEIDRLAQEPERLERLDLRYLMSHLVSAEASDEPLNAAQRERFVSARDRLPPMPASLANSSGIFLGPDYHFDLARPGAALYGVAPVAGQPNPMAQTVRLQGRILQIRDVDSPQTVGYGATHLVRGATRIATVAVGYADGYLRHLSGLGHCFMGDLRLPVVGRVSMDLITLDVTAVPPDQLAPGQLVDILSDRYTVDDAAAAAETIGYEILTSLGRRYHRRYVGGVGPD